MKTIAIDNAGAGIGYIPMTMTGKEVISMSSLNPEEGGGGVENSTVGFTAAEAKANWAAFKAGLSPLIAKVEVDFSGLWNALLADVENGVADIETVWPKIVAFIESIIAKL